MSSVSAACIFDAYSASSAHTDTFYIVSQIVRVRNSKRHFFSKLTFRISFNHSASPYGNIDHSHSASPYDNIDHSHSASPYGNIDHSRSASPYGHIDHSRSAFTLRQHWPQPLRFTLRQHRPQPLCFTLRPHRPQPVISHNKAVWTALPKIFRIFLKKPLTNTRKPCIIFTVIWVWRRLVARYLGVVEAAGSNPVTQTN